MQILIRETKTVKREIGQLDWAKKMILAPRIKRGMKSQCAVCGKEITGEFFIAGFKAGQKNMMMHEDCQPYGVRVIAASNPIDQRAASAPLHPVVGQSNCPVCNKPIEEGNMSSTGYIDYCKACYNV